MNTSSSASAAPVRVAVIGGGCAALTTAFELTRPEHKGRYQVTVYQMGWRLGGKGASGRGVSDRIEEHGLHLWMGFYENAFRLMRDCYEERRTGFPNCRFADWRDAFKPAPDVGVADRTGDGWSFWLAHFPPGRGEPGDPTEDGPFTVRAYLQQSAMLIGELVRSAAAMQGAPPRDSSARPAESRTFAGGMEALIAAVNALLRYGPLAATSALLEAADLLRVAFEASFPQLFSEAAWLPMQLIDLLAAATRRELHRLATGDDRVRRVWHVIDLILAILRGSLRHGLLLDPRGFDAINSYDWREWLRLNGASEQALDSGFIRGIYDLTFAFEDGDVNRPRMAAGVALRGAMRMFFTYRGALFWRMSAGMGDVVFAPLYQVLKKRGVRFEFFHRIKHLRLSPHTGTEPSFIQAVDFDVQARVKRGAEYQPLVDIHKVPSWPASPDFRQLMNGARLQREGRAFEASWETRRVATKTIAIGSDFDFVVLGIGIGAVPEVARELIERDAKWKEMIRHVRTVPTQAFQIWLRKDVRELGWTHPPGNLAGFVEPFDTWADMSHLVPEETWNGQVKSIAYFCSVLPDSAPPGGVVTERLAQDEKAKVRANAIRFLKRDIGALWPKASPTPGEFDWSALAGENADEQTCEGRFDTQFWTANINPTDRYVQSLPGSIIYRISPLDMTFDNLTIAGDWTATGLDSGCIESAVISGRLAAHAISQSPRLEDIPGYDHP